jgi:hypothetical protein
MSTRAKALAVAALGHGLGADVDHRRAAALVEVREPLGHGLRPAGAAAGRRR